MGTKASHQHSSVSNAHGYLSGTHNPCLSWQHLFSQKVTAWQFICCPNHMNHARWSPACGLRWQMLRLNRSILLVKLWSTALCSVYHQDTQEGQGKEEAGSCFTLISFRGKTSTPHLPKESWQCGSDYIAAFGLKCPKPLLVLWICFVWVYWRVVGRKPCQAPNLFQAFLCTAWCQAQQKTHTVLQQ